MEQCFTTLDGLLFFIYSALEMLKAFVFGALAILILVIVALFLEHLLKLPFSE